MVRSLFFLFFRTLDESADKDGNFPGNVPGTERKFYCLFGGGFPAFFRENFVIFGAKEASGKGVYPLFS